MLLARSPCSPGYIPAERPPASTPSRRSATSRTGLLACCFPVPHIASRLCFISAFDHAVPSSRFNSSIPSLFPSPSCSPSIRTASSHCAENVSSLRGRLFRFSAAARPHQCRAQRFAHRVIPGRRFVVNQCILHADGSAKCYPPYENHVSLDPVAERQVGHSRPQFNYKFGDNEKKMCEDMANAAQEMFETAGFEIVNVDRAGAHRGLVDPRARHRADGQRTRRRRS